LYKKAPVSQPTTTTPNQQEVAAVGGIWSKLKAHAETVSGNYKDFMGLSEISALLRDQDASELVHAFAKQYLVKRRPGRTRVKVAAVKFNSISAAETEELMRRIDDVLVKFKEVAVQYYIKGKVGILDEPLFDQMDFNKNALRAFEKAVEKAEVLMTLISGDPQIGKALVISFVTISLMAKGYRVVVLNGASTTNVVDEFYEKIAGADGFLTKKVGWDAPVVFGHSTFVAGNERIKANFERIAMAGPCAIVLPAHYYHIGKLNAMIKSNPKLREVAESGKIAIIFDEVDRFMTLCKKTIKLAEQELWKVTVDEHGL
jgi:hypothetical protein